MTGFGYACIRVPDMRKRPSRNYLSWKKLTSIILRKRRNRLTEGSAGTCCLWLHLCQKCVAHSQGNQATNIYLHKRAQSSNCAPFKVSRLTSWAVFLVVHSEARKALGLSKCFIHCPLCRESCGSLFISSYQDPALIKRECISFEVKPLFEFFIQRLLRRTKNFPSRLVPHTNVRLQWSFSRQPFSCEKKKKKTNHLMLMFSCTRSSVMGWKSHFSGFEHNKKHVDAHHAPHEPRSKNNKNTPRSQDGEPGGTGTACNDARRTMNIR